MKKFFAVMGIAFALICGFAITEPTEVYAEPVVNTVEENEAEFKQMLQNCYDMYSDNLEEGYSDVKVENVHICENSPEWNGFIQVSAMKDGVRVWSTECGHLLGMYNYLLILGC